MKECGEFKNSLWSKDIELEYNPLIIQSVGFSNEIPKLSKIERDSSTADTISPGSPLFAYWVTLLGVREGDIITLKVMDPNNKVFAERQITQDKTRARQFYYTGRRLNDGPLQEGAYSATVTVERAVEGQEPIKREMTKAVLVSY